MRKMIAIMVSSMLMLSVAHAMHVGVLKHKEIPAVPKSTISAEYKPLGRFVTKEDSVLKRKYGFLVYKETNLNTGKFIVTIKSNLLTGTVFTQQKAKELARAAFEAGQRYKVWGHPFNAAGARDPRQFEYRLHQRHGKPTSIEIYTVVRGKGRRARAAESFTVPWPSR